MGGSIARGQQWEHSDLELGYLLPAGGPPVDYFATDSGRGVERIPLDCEQLERDLAAIDAGDRTPIVSWPIQLFQGRVLHDPTGLLRRFSALFDEHLFSAEILELKIARHLESYREHAARVTAESAAGRPCAALAWLRSAVNELILVQYWTCRDLPRSQNRTDSRLRDLGERHGLGDFYQLYRDVYALDSAPAAIAEDWPLVRDEVLAIAASWQGGAGDFFEQAVDSTFSWGEDGGIIGVYRIYIPIIGGSDGLLGLLDDDTWAGANASLLRFLGLTDAPADALFARVRAAATHLERPRGAAVRAPGAGGRA